jgi:predicted dehydrogenase
MKEIRWGIIGCGNVTEVKSGPGFQKATGSRLVAVIRRDGALAKDYAERHQVPRWYDDADVLIKDKEVDAIYVATPPSSHKMFAIAAAEAGKPVYVEKPMAMNDAECQEMVCACEAAGVPLFVAYYRRALPRFLKVKELLESGAIGKICFVSVTQVQPAPKLSGGELPWRLQPQLSGGGLFLDLASHTLDLLDFLLGPIAEVKGHASNQSNLYAAEDIVSGSWVCETGIQGMGTWCFSGYRAYERNEIVGTKGKIVFSTFADDPVQLVRADGEEQWDIAHPAHIQQPLIQTITDELLGRPGAACPSTGRSAARTSRVMEEMIRDYYQK